MSVVATALFAGCGGSQPLVGAVAQSRAVATHAERGRSWMLPEAKSSDLLYVSDQNSRSVYVFSYPAGKLIGALTVPGTPEKECVDSKGDVWITDFPDSQIIEYKHGGTKPVSVLDDTNGFPVGCAVDPETGEVAVVNWTSHKYRAGNVVVYDTTSGAKAVYSVADIFNLFACGYDDKGDLFVDSGRNTLPILAELGKGTRSFKDVKADWGFLVPGAIQWDGKYLAIGDQGYGSTSVPSRIYQVKVGPRGDRATLVGTTQLGGSQIVVQFWKQGRTVVGADCGGHDVGFWKYPAGGAAIKTIRHHLRRCLIGAVVSLAHR